MSKERSRSPGVAYHLAACCLLAITGAILYWPGLQGPFLFDDFGNIIQNQLLQIRSLDPAALWGAATSGNAGPTGRPIPMLTFALNFYLAGGSFDPFAFKLTNLVIHLVNSVLVYFVSVSLALRLRESNPTRVTTRPGGSYMTHLPLLVAAVWAFHPIQLTSVLYVVQRMTSLSALFVFAGLLLFLAGRRRLQLMPGRALLMMTVGLVGGTGLGVMSKENAALLPVLAFLVEIFFFRAAELPRVARRGLTALYASVVFLPVAAGVAALVVYPDYITSVYELREFTVLERLMTEARVLFFYVGLLMFPDLRDFGLYHGDFAVSTSLVDPWTTLLAGLGWVALATAIGLSLRRRWIWAFGIGWFMIGHGLESSIIGLELVHEHRNYLPSFGLLFGAVYYAMRLLVRLQASPRVWWPALAGSLAVLGFLTFSRASIWGDGPTLARMTARNHPAESRALGLMAASRMLRGDDVRVIYAAFRDAAAADDKTIYQLIEMAKIIAGAEALVRRRPDVGGVGAEGDSDGSLFDRELSFDSGRLEETRRLVHLEIDERLKRYVVTGETTRSLVELQMCSRANVDVCTALGEPSLDWHRVALANDRVSPRNRAWLALSAAKLYAHRGDIAAATDLVRQAIALDPGYVGFPLQLADLYLFLGDLDRAEAIIASLEDRDGLGAFWSRHVATLRRNLDRARSRAGADPSAGRATRDGAERSGFIFGMSP